MEDDNGCGCFGCSGLLLAFAALALYPAVTETMRGTPLTSPTEWGSAEGGELLEGGGRAAPGQMIKPSGYSVTLSDHLVGLIVGGGALVVGILALLIGLGERGTGKRKSGKKDRE